MKYNIHLVLPENGLTAANDNVVKKGGYYVIILFTYKEFSYVHYRCWSLPMVVFDSGDG